METSKASFRPGTVPGHGHQSEHSLLLVPEHKFGHRSRAQALAPEIVLEHRARVRALV